MSGWYTGERGSYRDPDTTAAPFLTRPSFMDGSPVGGERMDSSSRRSSSTSSTPLDADAQLKRAREEELDAYLAVPPNKRMETSPCTTPIHSPEHMGGAAMVQSTPIASCNIGTPLAGHRPSGAAELGLRWAFSQRQGPRNGQEDRIACKFDEGHNCNGHSLRHAYFGVFDGHGGDEASQWCADSLHTNVLGSPHFPEALVSALHDGFLRTDADWLARAGFATLPIPRALPHPTPTHPKPPQTTPTHPNPPHGPCPTLPRHYPSPFPPTLSALTNP